MIEKKRESLEAMKCGTLVALRGWTIALRRSKKLSKKIVVSAVMGCGMAIVGCQSGMYNIDLEEKNCDAIMPYREVDSLDPDIYTSDSLPVKVSVNHGGKQSDGSVLFSLLTVGVIPAFFDDYETYTMVVETPLGTNSCQGTIHAKSWIGWLCFVPYPGSAKLRTSDPDISVCPQSVKLEMRQKMLNALVSQFKKEEYAQYYQNLVAIRKKENKRLADKIANLTAKLKEGKYDEVIRACNAEDKRFMRNAQWAEFVSNAIAKTRDSIPQIQDAEVLLKLFDIYFDVYEDENLPLVDKIVIRLGQLKGVKSIDKVALKEYAFYSTTNGQARAAAMREMDVDEIRDRVWWGESTDIMVTYINVFGTDEEMAKIAKSYADKIMIPEILEAAKLKSPHVGNIVKFAAADVVATRVYDDFVNDVSNEMNSWWNRGQNPQRYEFYLNANHARKATRELCQNIERADENIRSAIAPAFVNKLAQNNFDVLWFLMFAPEKFVGFLSSAEAMSVFDRNITDRACRETGYFGDGYLCPFLRSLAKRIPRDVLQERYHTIIKKAEGQISFGGYYCHMPIKDFVIVGTITGIWPDRYDISSEGQNIQKLYFNNRTRYKILEVDDDRFWPTFMGKYDKSFLGDYEICDGEGCKVYKSSKLGVKVFFGQESGFLTIISY